MTSDDAYEEKLLVIFSGCQGQNRTSLTKMLNNGMFNAGWDVVMVNSILKTYPIWPRYNKVTAASVWGLIRGHAFKAIEAMFLAEQKCNSKCKCIIINRTTIDPVPYAYERIENADDRGQLAGLEVMAVMDLLSIYDIFLRDGWTVYHFLVEPNPRSRSDIENMHKVYRSLFKKAYKEEVSQNTIVHGPLQIKYAAVKNCIKWKGEIPQ